MMKDNRLWVLMSRRLSGEASAAEQEELQQLLNASPDKHYLLDILHSYFTAPGAGEQDSEGDALEERFLKVIEKGGGDPPKKVFFLRPRRMAMLAAVLIPLLGICIFLLRPATKATPGKTTPATSEVLSKAGVRTRMVLPDGTKVWLNASSKLRYAQFTGSPTREVVLEGEAFFDVAKDPQRPFIVHADSLDINVLGTAFTVKSYPQDSTIEATLLNGAIEITRKNNANTARIILKPNEKLVFNKHPDMPVAIPTPGTATTAKPPDMAVNSIARNLPDSEKVETGWMYNKLVFDGDSFKELAEKMERWYNVRIIFKDPGLYQHHFGGSFTHESIQEALNALQLTAGFTYKIKGNEIELYEK